MKKTTVLKNLFAAALVIPMIFAGTTDAQIINTIAGTGSGGYSGDGGAATMAQIYLPANVVVDRLNNVYIADNNNHRIRKINSSGIITTIAGTGTSGSGGDGGQATMATINSPNGLAVDAAGNIYMADINAHKVRKINSSGVISTIAGLGVPGFGGDGGNATVAALAGPNGVTVDAAGNVYICEYTNDRIRQVSPTGTIITYAGNGTAGYGSDGVAASTTSINHPGGVAVDNVGNLYIADAGNNRIRKVSTAGIITTFAGTGTSGFGGDGGPATAALLANPTGVGVDGNNYVYIADMGNKRIRKIDASGNISTVAGGATSGFGDGGPATAALLNAPASVGVSCSGSIYISDFGDNRIRMVTYPGSCALAVEQVAGVKELAITVFPNPNSGFFILNLSTAKDEKAVVIISDLLGKKVKEFVINTNEAQELQLQIPPGVYVVTAVTKDRRVTRKMVVE